jgi:hypothetical protein
MFPIAAESLSILQIARYWSREISPPVSPEELRLEIEKAWWRRDLKGEGPSPLSVLRSLYGECQDCIAFVPSGEQGPPQFEELADGKARVFRLVRVPVPSPDPKMWTEANSAESLVAVANDWELIPERARNLVDPIIAGTEVAYEEFHRWVTSQGYKRPRFWTKRAHRSPDAKPSRPAISRREANAAVARAVEELRKQKLHPSEAGVKKRLEAERLRIPREWLREEWRKAAKPRPGRPSKNSP